MNINSQNNFTLRKPAFGQCTALVIPHRNKKSVFKIFTDNTSPSIVHKNFISAPDYFVADTDKICRGEQKNKLLTVLEKNGAKKVLLLLTGPERKNMNFKNFHIDRRLPEIDEVIKIGIPVKQKFGEILDLIESGK